jgi:very-short-patch-repair endonuclease
MGGLLGKSLEVKRHYVDKYVVRKLEEQGWTVLRFWEHEIMEDVGGCVNHIKEVL